jgi:PfaB family protein
VTAADRVIAIVSVGTVCAADDSLAGFWQAIASGRDLGQTIPTGRWFWPAERAVGLGTKHPDGLGSAWCCPLGDAYRLPFETPDWFRSPSAALTPSASRPNPPALRAAETDPLGSALDPLCRLALTAAERAWAGTRWGELARSRVGVILGHIVLPTESTSALGRDLLVSEFARRWLGAAAPEWQRSGWSGRNWSAAALPAQLIAARFELGGPAYTLDAACASSLYALKLACEELLSGRMDAMIAGGLSRPDCQYTQLGFSKLQALSQRGRCAPLSAEADGLVVGEGAGLFVLKRLSTALADGDRIWATLHGVGLSNDRGANLLAPHSEGQLRAMEAAYHQAGWSPHEIDLLECHATGTPIGDGVELNSLHQLWRDPRWPSAQGTVGTPRPRSCVVGSVKSNVGHWLTGAGGAGVLKLLLAMEHAQLPPTANVVTPAAALQDPSSPFRLLSQVEPWERRSAGQPRRAAINAFGFGGINAHVLLQEWTGQDTSSVWASPPDTSRAMTPSEFMSPAMTPAAVTGGADSAAIAVVGWALAPETRSSNATAIDPEPPAGWGVEVSGVDGWPIKSVQMPIGEFRIPPLELEEMLPQQQLMLQVTAKALQQAGYDRTLGNRAGVFIGIALDPNTTLFHGRWSLDQYLDDWLAAAGRSLSAEQRSACLAQLRDAFGPPLTSNRVMGNLGGIVASRLAREFEVGGPSFTVSSDETSGLNALQIAVTALQRGEIDLAMVGAIDFPCDVRRAWADRLRCPQVADAAVAVVLCREADARRDGRAVWAVVTDVDAKQAWASEERSAESADSLTATQPGPQLPTTTHHGSRQTANTPGSPGPIAPAPWRGAATGLVSWVHTVQAWHTDRSASGTNTAIQQRHAGHADTWTPVLAIPTAEFRQTSVSGDTVAVSWREPAEGVWTRRTDGRSCPPSAALPVQLVPLTGATVDELQQRLEQAERFLSTQLAAGESWSTAVARWFHARGQAARQTPATEQTTALTGEAMPSLVAVIIATNMTEFFAGAAELRAAWSSPRGATEVRTARGRFTPDPLAPQGQLAFVFPGSGNHFLGMGRELCQAFPHILRQQSRESQSLREQFRPDLLWDGTSAAAIGQDHKAMIFGQVAVGSVVCDWLAWLGVQPAAAIGYSLGESAALFGLRAWTDRDEMYRRMCASSLFGSDLVYPFRAARQVWNIPHDREVEWLSAVVDHRADEVREVVARTPRTFLLLINTPQQCVIGGERRQVERVLQQLGTALIPLPFASTVHCDVLQPVASAYTALHLMPTSPPDGVSFYSSATGQPYGLSEAAAAGAILSQAIGTVDFVHVIQQAWQRGVRLFVEIGPGHSCTRMIEQILQDRPHWVASVLPSTADPLGHALRVLADLLCEGVPVDLRPLFGAATPQEVPPSAAFDRFVITPCAGPPFAPPRWDREPLATQAGLPSAIGNAVDSAAEIPPAFAAQAHTAAVPLSRFSMPASQPLAAASSLSTAAAAEPSTITTATINHRHPNDHAGSQANPSATSSHTTPAAPAAAVAAFEATATATNQTAAAAQTTGAVHGSLDSMDRPPLAGANWDAWLSARHAAHAQYLSLAHQLQQAVVSQLTDPMPISTADIPSTDKPVAPVADSPAWSSAAFTMSDSRTESGASSPAVAVSPIPTSPPRSLNYDQCLEYAIGKIGRVLGPLFAEIDQYPTRVRLPDVPLMLVDRILSIEGEPLSMTHGRVVTEHDIHADDWYLDGGRIPTCLAVESGQADLFLSGWLGIDLQTRGEAMYRLLDAVVTFHDHLPGPGQTIHYDIRINRFFQQGQTYLFRFEFDATVDGRPLLTMRDGCAGFFTPAELAAGQGIVHTALDRQPQVGKRPAGWSPPVPLAIEAYSDEQLAALRHGDLAACFGPVFANLPLTRPETLPDGRLNLVHRVLQLNPSGGKYGLGSIRAEADIHPDDWFLTCHFCDDQVMPGTLMYECCLHTLRIYLLRMGWIGERGHVAYEPVPGVRSRLKCRGQVLASTQRVWYEVTLKELGPSASTPVPADGDGPWLYCLADALMYADGKPIVEITEMSVRLTGLKPSDVDRLWSAASSATVAAAPTSPVAGATQPVPAQPGPKPVTSLANSRAVLFDTDRITEFAIGKPSRAFGDRYLPFDNDRMIARLPGPPFQFLDRIVSIEQCQPWVLQAGGEIIAEYDVPPDAWYFSANRQPVMPFAVLLEAALQPCGWLAAYLGSALTSDVDLSFRNLGGEATQFVPVTPNSGTLTTRVKITQVSQSAGMIIQHYQFDLRSGDQPVYVGKTYFGFFSKSALANQVGIRDAAVDQPSPAERQRGWSGLVPTTSPLPDDRFRMVSDVDVLTVDGGPAGLGLVVGHVSVDPNAWFFQAHFFQDPVWPGSLGLESFLQLLKLFALKCWNLPETTVFHTVGLNDRHRWVYRGQVIPSDRTVTVTVVVTARDDARQRLTAGGFLSVDGRVIYQMIDFTLQVAQATG